MNGTHDLFGTAGAANVCKVMLTNVAPVATNTVKANLTDIAAGNGYTAGGEAITNNGTRATGTFTLTATKVVWTAAGGTIGPFRYCAVWNDTPTSPADPLICWFDHGSAVTLQIGETFSIKWNGSETTGTLFTLA